MINEFKDIDRLSPSDFEIFIRDVFLASGWSEAVITEVGKEFKYGDGGVDIFAYKGKRKFAIEVKQRNIATNVDVKALNQLVTGADLANVNNKILVTNSYFTSEVQTRALRLGVELIDRDSLQNLWVEKHSEIGRDIKPRKYQHHVIEDALTQYRNGKSKLLIEMATGLGKTYTVAHIIRNLIRQSGDRPRILFIAHQVEILLQSVTAFKNVFGIGNYSFSACFSGSKPEDTDFVFASFDTLFGQIHQLEKNTFDFIVVDEAHHTPARTYSQVVTSFQPKLLIGLTATPYRADNQSVINFFGGSDGHIGKFDLVWALKHRKLAFPKYLVLLNDLDQEKIDQLDSGLSITDLDERLFLHKKDEEVVRIIEKTVKEKKIENVKGIVFCRSIKHMRHLLNYFKLGSATLVHSKMTDQERRGNIRNFREGKFEYILVCDLFNEGIDIPETNLLVFMRYTGSKTIWLQQLGRGLRKTRNKEYVNVLDFVGSLERLNEVTQLQQQVDRTKLDRDNLIDDEGEQNIREEFHDGQLEVSYSEEAAKVLELIENFKMRLNSRGVLIDKLRQFHQREGYIPDIAKLEERIFEIGCDQVATHFDSYLGYVRATFGGDIGTNEILDKINKYIGSYSLLHSISPSIKGIALNFMVNQLYTVTEKEIELLLPDYEELAEMKSQVTAALEPETKIAKRISKDKVCVIIEKYQGKISSRADFKELYAAELSEIKEKYRSTSVFLRQLKGR